ncbi:hypothetical protein AGDE_15330 [Angomonas deanei]|uniref:Uncharacterized protein n=1 Tax=Angomonas deanei TaxID=59799 RepID=A0A7G2C7P2_9TRYP|nr:hypothetical protein AGDE_15330 [Angomonas deanei]CAD2215599.1 hypothetical protein, conserved [Angomonas deanei]|eukprot:EPY19257.1 hypothetical protein AGDE_15330 [Angomonas deanei]
MDIHYGSPPTDEVLKESTAAPETETVHVGVGSAPVVAADEQRRRWSAEKITICVLLLCSFAFTLLSMWVPFAKVDLFSSATLSTNTPYEKSLCSEGCGAVNSTGVGHQYELVRSRFSGFLQKLYDAHGGASTYECVSTDGGYTVRLLFHYGELYSSYKTSCTDPVKQETVFEGKVQYERNIFGRQVVGSGDNIKDVSISRVVFDVLVLVAHVVLFIRLLIIWVRRDWKNRITTGGCGYICWLVWCSGTGIQIGLTIALRHWSYKSSYDGGATKEVSSVVGRCIVDYVMRSVIMVCVLGWYLSLLLLSLVDVIHSPASPHRNAQA